MTVRCECRRPVRDTADPERRHRCADCHGWTLTGRPVSAGEVAYLLRQARSFLDRLEVDHRFATEAAYGIQAPTGLRSGAGGHSNPTAAPWTSLRRADRVSARAECAWWTALAGQQLKQAVAWLIAADESIGRACHAVDNPGPPDHTPAPYHDPATLRADRPDLAGPIGAQARRRGRGEL